MARGRSGRVLAISHIEIRGSREGMDANDRSSRAELVRSVSGSDDLDELRTYLGNVVPTAYDGLVYRSLSWEHLGKELWEFRATYVEPDRSDREHKLATGSYLFSFDTTGGMVTISTSQATTAFAKSGQTAPDFKNAINVADGEVKGTEIVIPVLKFSLRKRQEKAVITTAYVKILASLTGTVNAADFQGFAAGELLFMGASGQQGTDTDPEVTYNFAASENATGLSIGEVAGIAKKGHEYLWVVFEPVDDPAAKTTVRRPKAVYVERVYKEANWAPLAI
jgi:hypothetical protein